MEDVRGRWKPRGGGGKGVRRDKEEFRRFSIP